MGMAVYVIIDIAVRDEAAKGDYLQYVEKVRPIVEKHGGRYLVRGGRITPIAGNWKPERVVLIEFPLVGRRGNVVEFARIQSHCRFERELHARQGHSCRRL